MVNGKLASSEIKFSIKILKVVLIKGLQYKAKMVEYKKVRTM